MLFSSLELLTREYGDNTDGKWTFVITSSRKEFLTDFEENSMHFSAPTEAPDSIWKHFMNHLRHLSTLPSARNAVLDILEYIICDTSEMINETNVSSIISLCASYLQQIRRASTVAPSVQAYAHDLGNESQASDDNENIRSIRLMFQLSRIAKPLLTTGTWIVCLD